MSEAELREALAEFLRRVPDLLAQVKMQLPLFLTVKQASLYSGLSEALLAKFVEDGMMPAVKDEDQWKISGPALMMLARGMIFREGAEQAIASLSSEVH